MPPRRRRPKRKRADVAVTPPEPPCPTITIVNINVRIEKKSNNKKKLAVIGYNDFRFIYEVELSDKCCHGRKWITAASTNDVWETDKNQRAMKMKEKAISALHCHREKSGDCCCLNCETDSNIITPIDSFWEYLWSQAQNMCSIEIADSQKKSINALRGAHRRVVESDWEMGIEFLNRGTKCFARKKVLECLEYNSKKSILKAYSILSYLIRKISKAASSRSIEFDEMKVLTHKQQKRVVAMNAIIESASSCINSMKKRIDKSVLVF